MIRVAWLAVIALQASILACEAAPHAHAEGPYPPSAASVATSDLPSDADTTIAVDTGCALHAAHTAFVVAQPPAWRQSAIGTTEPIGPVAVPSPAYRSSIEQPPKPRF